MRSFILTSGFIILNLLSSAQNNTKNILYGLVVDENSSPIENVNILELSKLKGGSTDNKGQFYLPLDKLPVEMKISHINYYTKVLKIKLSEYNNLINDTLKITIQLEEKINVLSPFEISSEKIKLVYNKSLISILDYQFYKDNLLLLLKENKATKLILIGSSEKIVNELELSIKSEKLFKDCFGNFHLLSKDSSYQIGLSNVEIAILYSYSMAKFLQLLYSCAVQLNNRLLFMQLGKHRQSLVYFYLNENNEKFILKIIRNIELEQYASQEIGMIKHLENILEKRSSGAGLMAENLDELIIAREIFDQSIFYEKVLSKPIYSPLLKISKDLYIFDHQNNTCFSFDKNLQLQKEIPINYHLKKGWAKELILDNVLGEVYAKFEKGGLCYLKKIDLTTGKIIESFKLEKHTFPTNIKIRNGEAYYLYKDMYNHGQMSLYKQGLY